MKKILKILGVIGFAVVLFLAVAVIAFYHLVRVGDFRRFLVSELERKTELKVQLGAADLEMGRVLGIAFRDLALSERQSSQPMITAERITARVALFPLLRRRVVFSEIRLHRPAARMVRDPEGNVPLLDKLLSLPFLKEEEIQFSVDLRSIRLDQGEVAFEDHRAEGEVTTTRFHDIALELQRIRGQKLRDFLSRELLGKTGDGDPGQALDFGLRSTVERDGMKTTLQASGKMIFPKESLDFRDLRWDARVQFADLPGEMLQRFAGARLPVESVKGSLSSRLRLEGGRKQRIQFKGEVLFKQLVVGAPEFFVSPLTPGDGRLALEVEWTPGRLVFPRLDIRSEEINLSLKGAVRPGADSDPKIDLSISTPSLPVSIVRKYLPLRFLDSPRLESLATAIHEGELQLKKARVTGSLSEIRRLTEPGPGYRVWLDAEMRGVAAAFNGNSYLPLREVRGRILFENGVLSVRDLEGKYGRSRLTEAEGSYRGTFGGQGALELHARGELDLGELREQLKLGVFPAQVVKLSSSVQEMGGTGRFDLALHRSLEAPLQVEGKMTLDNARLRMGDFSLTELKGDLSLSSKEIRADKAGARLSGSPIQIRLAVRDYLSDNGSFDLAIDSPGVRAGAVTRLLLGTGSLQDPGTVRGSVRYQGSLAPKGERKFTGTLDLAGVQISPEPLKQPLRELNGRVRVDEKGIDFQGLKGLLVGSPFDFSGRWRYAQEPQLFFTFASPVLDISNLISQIDEESGDWYDHLQARGKVTIAKGRFEGFEFSDLESDLRLDRRVWHLSNFAARSTGGTVQGAGTITDRPGSLGFSVEPKVQGVPVKGFLSWFDVGTTEITGRVTLTGKLESIGGSGPERKKNLNGGFNLKIEDGTVRRMRILIQILNLLDLSRWFTLQMPDINKEGIRFRSITGDFKVTQGVYSTQNLLVDSGDLRMTGAGRIDAPNDDIDFVVAVRPFPGVDSAINFIPLIGRGIAAIKNSFLVASFSIRGSMDRPTITPAPLSTLSEVFLGVLGIPKGIIGLSGEGKTEEKKQAPGQPTP